MDTHPSDIIVSKIKPVTGAIKITRIDGFLDKKCKWSGSKWVDICRYNGCSSDIDKKTKKGLCPQHYRLQVQTVVEQERRVKYGQCFRFIKGEWKLMCSVEGCSYTAVNNEEKCVNHLNGETAVSNSNNSTIQNTVNIYHQLKKDMENEMSSKIVKGRKI